VKRACRWRTLSASRILFFGTLLIFLGALWPSPSVATGVLAASNIPYRAVPAKPKLPAPVSEPPASTTEFATESEARKACPTDETVWLNGSQGLPMPQGPSQSDSKPLPPSQTPEYYYYENGSSGYGRSPTDAKGVYVCLHQLAATGYSLVDVDQADDQSHLDSSVVGALALTVLFLLLILSAYLIRARFAGMSADALLVLPMVAGLFGGLIALLFTPGLGSFAWIAIEIMGMGFYTVGLAVGFLFAVPRYADSVSGNVDRSSSPQQPLIGALLPNTNLAKISDWLTTAITAITLSQLRGIPTYITEFGNYLDQSLSLTVNGHAYGGALAIALSSYFPALGFISGCVVTMIYIPSVLRRNSIWNPEVGTEIARGARQAAAAEEAQKRVPVTEGSASVLGVSGELKTLATKITSQANLSQLTTADDLATWARAQATLGNWASACDAYQRAIELRPDDPRLLEDYATALFNNRAAPDRIASVYQRALVLESDKSSKARILANIALAYLYDPGKYNTALQYLDQVLDDPSMPKEPIYYFWRACANGQKWEALSKSGKSPENLQYLQDAIMKDTQVALQLDPNLKRSFRWVADPNYRPKDPTDNDLEAFAVATPEFRTLIGMPL